MKAYQCPYEKQCKCSMTEPCEGCETWSEHDGVMYLEKQKESIEKKIGLALSSVNKICTKYNEGLECDESGMRTLYKLAKEAQQQLTNQKPPYMKGCVG